MFPSKAYKELCINNADRLREEWEPKFGDWVQKDQCAAIVTYIEGDDLWVEFQDPRYGGGWCKKVDCAPLFQPRQIIEMLEERGYGLGHLGDERLHPDFDGRDWNPEEPYIALAEREPGDYVKGTGPDPATALLRAWLEVVDEEEK